MEIVMTIRQERREATFRVPGKSPVIVFVLFSILDSAGNPRSLIEYGEGKHCGRMDVIDSRLILFSDPMKGA